MLFGTSGLCGVTCVLLFGETYFFFEPVEEFGVVALDCINEAGEQNVVVDLGVGEETMDEGVGASVFEIVRAESGCVKEGAVPLFATEQAFFEKPIESGHDRGVGERRSQPVGDLLDGSTAFTPKHGENLTLALTESGGVTCSLAWSNGARMIVKRGHGGLEKYTVRLSDSFGVGVDLIGLFLRFSFAVEEVLL
jgi:hypothetical protein